MANPREERGEDGGFMGLKGIAVPLVTGLVAAFVAYGHWRLVPLPER